MSQTSPEVMLADGIPLLAARLAHYHGYRHVVGIGPLSWTSAALTYPDVDVVELVPAASTSGPRARAHARLGWHPDKVEPPLPDRALARSAIVWYLPDGDPGAVVGLGGALPSWAKEAPLVVVVGATSLEVMASRLVAAGLQSTFLGRAPAQDRTEVSVAIIDRVVSATVSDPPDDFHILAIVTAYNEQDVIGSTIEALIDGGIDVYLIDNWSTDRTTEVASGFRGRGLLGLERFPAAPTRTYEWERLLARVEAIATTVPADWYIHHDSDERHAGPWPGLPLRHAIWRVQQSGFNAIDHTVLDFPPVDDGFQPGTDVERYFRHFEFGHAPGDFLRVKAWRSSASGVRLAQSGGHDVRFTGRRVFPYKFLLKHYPIRSQAHGERKVLAERRARWDPGERAKGWHVQYDDVRLGHRFVRSASELDVWDDQQSRIDHLVPLISGIGLEPSPLPGWAFRGRGPAAVYRLGRVLAGSATAQRIREGRLARSSVVSRPSRWLKRRLLGPQT